MIEISKRVSEGSQSHKNMQTYLSEGARPANNRVILHNAGDHGRYSEFEEILRFRARGHRILANRPNTVFQTSVNPALNQLLSRHKNYIKATRPQGSSDDCDGISTTKRGTWYTHNNCQTHDLPHVERCTACSTLRRSRRISILSGSPKGSALEPPS